MSLSPRYLLIQSLLLNNQDIIRKKLEALLKEARQKKQRRVFIRGASYYVEVPIMLNEESRRMIRELEIEELVGILDDWVQRLGIYAYNSFDD